MPGIIRLSVVNMRPDCNKLTVCVDLDGVLARLVRNPNGSFPDSLTIGTPFIRAQRFLLDLRESARVMIYTSRLSDHMADAPRGLRFGRVKHWLEDHGLPYDEIYLGYGKPPASAYVDDRAVVCRPGDDPTINDFEFALGEIQNLLNEERRRAIVFAGS